jgi:hypothetical protein
MKILICSCLASAAACGLFAAEAPPPIACNLKALTTAQRSELNRTGLHVIDAITSSRDLKDGYAFQVDPAKATLPDVAHWLDLWRHCCPFYDFQIDFHAADASLWLTVKGRPGVKEYIPVDVPQLTAKLPR